MNRKKERQDFKEELRNLIVQTRKKERKDKKKVEIPWVVKIVLLAFIISLSFSLLSEMILSNVNLYIGIFVVILFVMLGVLFDIIGVAVTASDIKPFNSMSSRKVKGAKQAVIFIQNADKVSSFCCDVIGDICGIISGSAGVTVAVNISKSLNIELFTVTLLVTAIIASLTIGGKALGKSFAINKSNIIIFEFSKFITNFYKLK